MIVLDLPEYEAGRQRPDAVRWGHYVPFDQIVRWTVANTRGMYPDEPDYVRLVLSNGDVFSADLSYEDWLDVLARVTKLREALHTVRADRSR